MALILAAAPGLVLLGSIFLSLAGVGFALGFGRNSDIRRTGITGVFALTVGGVGLLVSQGLPGRAYANDLGAVAHPAAQAMFLHGTGSQIVYDAD